jgi:6-phosphogluconolactonase (cycloisomerase 2 family)
VTTPDGRFVYTSNAGTATVSGFSIAPNGSLTPLPGTVQGANPAGAANIDITISSNGKFLYTLNAGKGTIGIFAIHKDGTLTNLGSADGLTSATRTTFLCRNAYRPTRFVILLVDQLSATCAKFRM